MSKMRTGIGRATRNGRAGGAIRAGSDAAEERCGTDEEYCGAERSVPESAWRAAGASRSERGGERPRASVEGSVLERRREGMSMKGSVPEQRGERMSVKGSVPEQRGEGMSVERSVLEQPGERMCVKGSVPELGNGGSSTTRTRRDPYAFQNCGGTRRWETVQKKASKNKYNGGGAKRRGTS